MKGLLTCKNFEEYYCIIKLIQVIISGILGSLTFLQIVFSIKLEGRVSLNTRLVILVLMLLALCFNFGYEMQDSLNSQILLYFQLYFASNFFLTIFYYVGDNVLKNRQSRIALHAFYVGLILGYTVILLIRVIKQTNRYQCSKKQYIIVNSFTILISILIFVLYCYKHMQQKKMQVFFSEKLISISGPQNNSKLSTPFMRMWILISTNIFCGIISLVQNILLYVHFGDTCKFSQDPNMNCLIHFIFLLFDFYLGATVTIIILYQIRIITIQSQNKLYHPLIQSRSISQNHTTSSSSIKVTLQNKVQLTTKQQKSVNSY